MQAIRKEGLQLFFIYKVERVILFFRKLKSFHAHSAAAASAGAAGAAAGTVPRVTLAGLSPSAAVNSVTTLEMLA